LNKGLFIAIEGIDGAGTTTQTKALSRRLEDRGQTVLATREPSDGPIGMLLRDILHQRIAGVGQSAVALLFAADRMDHLKRTIAPALAAGQQVISDRYYHSSLAYQSQFDDWDWIAAINNQAPPPDLTFILDLEVKEAMRRRAGRGAEEIFDDFDLQNNVAKAYRAMQESLPDERIIMVDGALPPNRITDILLDNINENL